jgi:hypothetical protein
VILVNRVNEAQVKIIKLIRFQAVYNDYPRKNNRNNNPGNLNKIICVGYYVK